MGYCVFMHRSDSIYDDSPAERYQFPAQYLGRARECVGDWIVYLEPTKVTQSRGYFAVARVQEIIPDPQNPNMYFAVIDPGTYLDFVKPVKFSDFNGPVEKGLLNESGRLSGRAQSAVRPIAATDFNSILAMGLEDEEPILPRRDEENLRDGFHEKQSEYLFEQQRERVLQLTSRVIRDRVFRKIVLKAYDERCSFTGLKLINGGGRAEVDAAHIKPVEHSGPDIIGNGIALSGTAHWMFDRGLISLGDNLEILISRHSNDHESVRDFVNKNGYAIAPLRAIDRPHPHFLSWHRQNTFKQ